MKIIGTAAAALLALSLAACSDDDASSDSPATAAPSASASASASTTPSAEASAEAATLDITVAANGKVTPQGQRVEVKRGEKITLHITAAADEEIHVHSDPEHEYEVTAGDDVTKSFTIDTPGQVAVEAHHADTVIAQLVVR